MTDNKIKEVAARYRDAIKAEVSKKYHTVGIPGRGPVNKPWSHWDKVWQLNHLLWACDQIDQFVAEGRRDKAFRWIGWLQGILVAEDRFTIQECGEHNMPPPESL